MTQPPPTTHSSHDVGTPARPWALWKIIAFGGLLAGLGELGLRALAAQFRPVPVFMNPAAIWMAPASFALLIALPVAVAWLLGRRRAADAGWRWPLTLALLAAACDVLLLVPRLYPVSMAMVAAGVAVQLVRWASRHEWVARRFVRYTALCLGAVSVLGGSVVEVGRVLRNRRLSALTTAGVDAPNVLLLVLDTVRAMQLSAYGYARPTSPRLSAFAAEGVRFERAVATTSWTLPSHATLLTGLYPHELSTGWSTPLDGKPQTLAERFAARGYATGGFVANFRYTTHEYGLGRGFHVYNDYALSWSTFVGSTAVGGAVIDAWNKLAHRYVLPGRKHGDVVVKEFLDFEEARGARPYFAFLNFFDAHEPYAPESPYDRLYLDSEPGTRTTGPELRSDTAAIRALRDAYDGSLTSLDAALGRLFDELRRRGSLDRTIVVITSDHGEEFAEHGHLSHGNGLHFPSLHVPLVIRWPGGGVPRGVVVPTPISLRDVPATLLSLTGDRGVASFPGVPLAPLWSGGSITPSPIVSELYRVPDAPSWYPATAGNLHSLVANGLHLIAGPGSREELYDVMSDPFERHDLSTTLAFGDTLRSMRAVLARWPLEERGGR